MADGDIYTRNDGTQFTGLPDRHGTSTPLMTDRKYNAIAAELAKPENRAGVKVIEDMAKAEAEALKAKKPFSQDGFLAKSPAGADGRAFLAKMQVDHGAQAENIADVMADRRKPAGQRLGEQRAVSVGGRPTLKENIAVAENHAKPVSYEAKKPTPSTPTAAPAAGSHTPAPLGKGVAHAQTGHASLKGMFGLAAGTVLTVVGAKQAAAAENKPMGLKHIARAAVENVLPLEAIEQERYTEAAVQLASRADITGGLVEGALRSGLRAMGADVDAGAIESAKKTDPKGALRDTNWNQRIHREQQFLMSPDHPGQLGSLKVKDAKGQDMNVAEALKNPAQRGQVFDEIAKKSANAKTPESKEMFREMADAAKSFMDLESKRRDVSAVQVAKREIPSGPQVAMTAAAPA